jgi:peptide/nickel transport system substrate-binding protein
MKGGTRVNRDRGYWQDLKRRRISRRRLLAGAAAAGAGLAVVGLTACGGGEEEEPGAASPVPGASPTSVGGVLEPVGTTGGFIHWYSYESIPLDTLDPHQTQIGPTYSLHSSVFSKVLKYDDGYAGLIGRDLAEGIPEIVDDLTYVVKIRPGATFHDTPTIRDNLRDIAPALPGRELTAEDVKYSIERQINTDSPKSALYYRASQWESVDKIEIVDDYTLRITTKRPTGPFIHYLADTNAFVVARELVDQSDEMNDIKRMVGTGPFMVDRYVPLQVSRAVRNPVWFAKDDLTEQGLPNRPLVDGYEAYFYAGDYTAMEAAFRSKQVDVFGTDDPDTMKRLGDELGLTVATAPSTGFINTRVLCDDSPAASTPFKDLRLRKAIHLAVDRNRMGQQMLKGGFYPVGPVSAFVRKWGIPLNELATKPGYRFGTQERDEDVAEAKKLWEAAGGSAVGKMVITHAGIPGYIKDFFPQLQGMLKDVLGLETEGDLDATGYTKLTQGALEKRLVLTFNFDNGWNDLDDWVYPYYHSKGTKNSFNLSDATLDGMLEAQRAEMDEGARQQKGFEIQDYLLENTLAMICWVGPTNPELKWSYFRSYQRSPWFGYNFNLANIWLDHDDPNFQGRPA